MNIKKECQKILLQMVRIGNILRFEDKENNKFIGVITDTIMIKNGFIKIFTNGSNDISKIFLPCLPIEYKTIKCINFDISLISDKEYQFVLKETKLSTYNKTKLEQNRKNSRKIITQVLKFCYRKFPKNKRIIFIYFISNN